MNTLLTQSASQLADALRRGEVKAQEVTEASLERIDQADPTYKAFITVDAAAARQEAARLDGIAESDRGPLHGIPIAIKDVTDVKGFPTTQGSLLTSSAPATADDVSVARLRAAGAVFVGKTNTPEFGFGAVCTNRFCGPTNNPWDIDSTSGGSSGGSAVAVATGMVPLAQGVDFGGSVRTPASFTGIVGLRPTPGTIPEPARPQAWNTLATQGVLARSVDDAELMLRVLAGRHPYDPTSQWTARDERDREATVRMAASTTMNDAYLVDPAVRDRFSDAVQAADAVLGPVEMDSPPVSGASDAFKILRAALSWTSFGELVENHERDLTASFVWNVRQGRGISAEDYLGAERVRARIYRGFQDFFDRYDVLMLPAASVLPFPNEQGEVMSIDGQPCESIIDYLACTYLVSLVGFPTIVVPAPSLGARLPFGVQLVARPHHEALLLHVAKRLETEGGFAQHWPPGLATAGDA